MCTATSHSVQATSGSFYDTVFFDIRKRSDLILIPFTKSLAKSTIEKCVCVT